jgi:hypothetical protein
LQSTNVIQNYLGIHLISKGAFVSKVNTGANFDHQLYYSHLKTKNLGSIIIHADLVASTMNTFDRQLKTNNKYYIYTVYIVYLCF